MQTGFALLIVLSSGTFGYYIITDYSYDVFTCFYMTVLTITTIGFDEIIPVGKYEAGRPFTVLIAFSGIGVLTYFVSTIAAIIIEGDFRKSYIKRKMEKDIEKLKEHYIICGIGEHSLHLIDELVSTERDSVCIDIKPDVIDRVQRLYPLQKYVEGDATHEDVLRKAGIENAKGIFATTNDDNVNLVISLLSRKLNPKIRIISLCDNHDNQDKILLAGADGVVSPNYLGGLRMANEMLRPLVATFLDSLRRDKNKNLRVEQIALKDKHTGKKIIELKLDDFKDTVIVAIKSNDVLIFKPHDDYQINEGDSIIVITSPLDRIKLEDLDK